MKPYQLFMTTAALAAVLACNGNGSGENKAQTTEEKDTPAATAPEKATTTPPTVHEYLANGPKGVGPISEFERTPFDQALADEGNSIFITQCSMCHRLDTKLLGPPLLGVTKRRTPEWILNMMLAPEKMIAEDPDAKALFEEYQTPMANLGLDEDGAKAVLEYLRLESSK